MRHSIKTDLIVLTANVVHLALVCWLGLTP